MAKMRLPLVEPSARARPVTEKSTYGPNSVLDAARHLYQEEGYKLIKQEA
jgi:hypothetical protein